MVYDETDDVYYVVSQHYDSRARDYYAAFVVLSSDGQRIGPPFELPHSTNLWIPKVQRSGRIWYLAPYATDDLIYSYDHTEIREWHLRDWVNVTGDIFDLYIGPTSHGRTFLVTRECVMIW